MQPTIAREANLLSLKYAVAKTISSDPIGWTILKACGGLIPHKGTLISVGDRNYKTAASIFWGIYESAELRFIAKHWSPAIDTIELGSSIGVISSYLSSRIEDQVRLVCVEANPKLIGILRGNLTRNQKRGRFELVEGAIHYASPDIAFSVAEANLNSRIASSADAGSDAVRMVRSVRLHDLISTIPGNWYQLICDIEGAEVDILENDAASLSRCGLLVMETHDVRYQGAQYDPDRIIKMVETRTDLRLLGRYGPVCVFSNERCTELKRSASA